MKNKKPIKYVTSIADFMDEVSEHSKQWKRNSIKEVTQKGDEKERKARAVTWEPWFRGEPEEYTTFLQPKLYRYKAPINHLLIYEGEMRIEFKRRGVQLITEIQPKDRWEWYFLMQHYGAPTRLLDWTSGALEALYFATAPRRDKEERTRNKPAVVYMLDPWWLNKEAFKKVSQVNEENQTYGVALSDWDEAQLYLSAYEFDNEELKEMCPLAIDPSHFSRRIAAQQSHFTIFGKDKNWLRNVNNRIVTISITNIEQIQHELQLCGISESTIFPDLEGLGREMDMWLRKEIRTNK